MKRLWVFVVSFGILGVMSASAEIRFRWSASGGVAYERHTPTSATQFSFFLDGFPAPARRALTERLIVVPGVRSATCHPTTHEVVVVYEPRLINRDRILTVVQTTPWYDEPRTVVVTRNSRPSYGVQRVRDYRDEDEPRRSRGREREYRGREREHRKQKAQRHCRR